MQKEITILVAKSGSGKSTYAQSVVINNNNTFIINRDSIRRCLVGNLDNYYSRINIGSLEDIVSNLEDQLFLEYYNKGYSMIIDNTNLKQRYIKKWLELAKNYKYNAKIKIFNIESAECKQRVLARDFEGKTTEQLVEYIDIQDKQFHSIVEWINNNYKDKILE